ncbi:hypothetical protein LVY72_11675 [Arthrobacter sp. I2-34]|uniref:Uncharacterized protein n=1 Tax=Arthrobacter hankyongi TaxID=2904801 RepID=A0ABS9L7B7_9MICC|nr:hypothetical protein [Arthrobacter hankyongi]MCG2622571.1 hypothetical protein [Arthrobacter hankyongi]
MAIENDYSASPFYRWAAEAGQRFSPDEEVAVHFMVNRNIAELGERVWGFLATGYIHGGAMDPQLALSIMDFAELTGRFLEPGDPRRTLVYAWEGLAEVCAVAQHNNGMELLNRADVILRVNALMTEADLPPELEMYAAILIVEWADFDWDNLDQLDPGLAAMMQSLHEEWQDEVLASFGVE